MLKGDKEKKVFSGNVFRAGWAVDEAQDKKKGAGKTQDRAGRECSAGRQRTQPVRTV